MLSEISFFRQNKRILSSLFYVHAKHCSVTLCQPKISRRGAIAINKIPPCPKKYMFKCKNLQNTVEAV